MVHRKVLSFGYAFKGIAIAAREEENFQIDVVIGFVALALGWYVQLSRPEWIVIIFLIGFVLTAEVFNTALEEVCDKFQPEHDPHIAKIKDLAAGAVLISALSAGIVGFLIFIPHIPLLI